MIQMIFSGKYVHNSKRISLACVQYVIVYNMCFCESFEHYWLEWSVFDSLNCLNYGLHRKVVIYKKNSLKFFCPMVGFYI